MKKQLLLSATFVLLVLIFNSCKKDKVKDYSALFNNTVWTGDYQYPNKSPQPYGMQFNSNGTMIFISSFSEYAGTYTIDASSKKINIDIANGAAKVSATIGNNELTGFTNITNHGYSFVSCKLNTTWDQNLDGTNWTLSAPAAFSTTLSFLTGNTLASYGTTTQYVRKAGTISFLVPMIFPGSFLSFFGVIEGSKMKGEWANGIWTATKQ